RAAALRLRLVVAQGDLPCGPAVADDLAATKQANAAPNVVPGAVAGPSSPAPALRVDPALVGTWEIMVPGGRGVSRWVWQILDNGTYKFHAEGPRPARAHEGTMTAMNGHWSIHGTRGLPGYDDGGAYEIHDGAAVITGKLGTGYWKR